MKQVKTGWRVVLAFLLSLAIASAYFLFAYDRLPFIYDINDDVAMRNVAAGVITGEPDGRLLHVKYVLGLLLSGLYRYFPGLDWYGLVFIGLVLLAFSVVLYRGLVSAKSPVWKLCYVIVALPIFTCLGLGHIAAFQWTVSAAAVGSAGLFLFYTAEDRETFQVYLEEGASVFLLLLALAVRDDVFLMLLPPAALCFCWKYGKIHRGRGKWPLAFRHLGVPLGLFLGVLFILGMEALAYSSPEWREFRSYNRDREAIMDYYGLPDYEEDPEYFDALGMTPEEAENLQRYSLYLTDGLYRDKMEALAKRSKELYLARHPFGERVKRAVHDIWEHWGKDTYRLANVFCLSMMAFLLVWSFWKDKREFALVLLLLSVWGAYWLYLGYRARILERVGFALYLLGFLLMLAVWYRMSFQSAQAKSETSYGKLAAIFLCVALSFPARRVWKEVAEYNQWRWTYNLEFLDVNRYMAEHMENVYFMTTFSIETYTDNFTIRKDFAFSNLLSVGGWHTFSPLENEKNRKLGISDPKRDIVEKENVYVISLENINLRYMDRYYASLYGENYQGRELTDALNYGDRTFEVYQFKESGGGK